MSNLECVDMDWSWITTTKPGDPKYTAGVTDFINFTMRNSRGRDKLPCPWFKCHNLLHRKVDEILNHLSKFAFDKTYTYWTFHGEFIGRTSSTFKEGDNEGYATYEGDRLEDMLRVAEENLIGDSSVVESLLSDSEKPLYPGCNKYTRLSSVLKLYNLKAGHGWTDTSFTALLELLEDMLPDENMLPKSTYESKKILCTTMGLRYEKIHACPSDCILYRNEYESLTSCPMCNTSRYKKNTQVAAKILWYFPIIPRFRRLYSNPGDAEKLTWHHNGRKKDGYLRHPADSPQWEFIDGFFPEFGKDERNLRLALSTDGTNPFSNLSSTYSTWPVILVTYNLSPTLCMKSKYMMLTLLISGPKQPGNDICVYLDPLIDDLKLLWYEGVEVYDAHRKEMFNLKAMLFCTIQDFPAYSNLSGYTVYGQAAYPLCEYGFKEKWLSDSGKNAFYGHRVFLQCEHHYRKYMKAFDGEQIFENRPKVFTSEEVYERVKNIQITYGKKQKNHLPKQGYKKCSRLWELPYWRFLFVRHSLDVMHIKKNVCESLIGTLLNIPGKSKDGPKSRADLQKMGIRPELHAVDKNGPRKYLPPAAYTLSKKEKVQFCECLARVKVPEGYSSNISSLVSMEHLKLMGLKSHDYHILMQHLLPVAIRGILPKNVRNVIIRLCSFFNAIYSKVINPKDLDGLDDEIIIILCQLEMYFPPSFFDIMIHLTLHLVREIRYCGPVYLRSQWPFERQNKTYKGYVKNAYRPEGCIAERVQYECAISLCSEFLGNVKMIGLPVSRHEDQMDGKETIGRKQADLSAEKWMMAHTYILHNEDEVAPYVERHMDFLKKKYNHKAHEKSIANEHNHTFYAWFKEQVMSELKAFSHSVD